MKKIALIIAMAGVFANSYGQGYVTVAGTFQNFTNSTLLGASYGGGSAAGGQGNAIGNLASGQAYTVALLTSTAVNPITNLFGSGGSLAANWLDTGPIGHNTGFAGRFSIGTDYLVNNAPVGNSQSWMLVAWSTSLGADWVSVAAQLASGAFTTAGYLGWSLVGVGAAGPPPTGLPLTIQGAAGSIIPNGMSLLVVPVPEPTSIALAGLGAASLLIFRRRKQ